MPTKRDKCRMNKLENELKYAVQNVNWTILEMKGFISDPILALTAGAAIGYRLALDHIQQELDKPISKKKQVKKK